jgi:small subunit ribosomal protein S4
MARYTGPKTRIARKFGEAIFGDDKSFERRNYPPGQHGMAKKRGKKSEYAIQLMEKQKAKYSYGILEKQFHNYYKRADSRKGSTGNNLIHLLESRLDNVVYRLGFAATRAEARQLVSHKAIAVNGKTVNIPSYLVGVNVEIAIKEKSKKQISSA